MSARNWIWTYCKGATLLAMTILVAMRVSEGYQLFSTARVLVLGLLLYSTLFAASAQWHATAYRRRRCLAPTLSIGLFVIAAIAFAFTLSGAADSQPKITCSMYHDKKLDEWWPENAWRYPGITKEQFAAFPFPNGLTQVDGRLRIAAASEIDVGDVLVFRTRSHPSIIGHRVIAKWTRNETLRWTTFDEDHYPNAHLVNVTSFYFSTIGDNALGQASYEKVIGEDQIVGVVGQAGLSSLSLLATNRCV